MGWAHGSDVMNAIIKQAQKHIPDDDARKDFYGPIYDVLCDMDWDTENESQGIDPVFDQVLVEKYPHIFGKEEE